MRDETIPFNLILVGTQRDVVIKKADILDVAVSSTDDGYLSLIIKTRNLSEIKEDFFERASSYAGVAKTNYSEFYERYSEVCWLVNEWRFKNGFKTFIQ